MTLWVDFQREGNRYHMIYNVGEGWDKKHSDLCLHTYILQVLLIGLLVFFAVNCINLIYVTTPSYADEHGVKKEKVADIMLYTAFVEIVMRILHGLFADRRIISALAQICIIMVLCMVGAALCAALPGLAGGIILCFFKKCVYTHCTQFALDLEN